MLRSAASSWTLFFGLLLIMAGNGLQVVLLGIKATEAGFSNITTGFVMAGYFLGIFSGSLLVPKLLDNVGHVRVFGAMAGDGIGGGSRRCGDHQPSGLGDDADCHRFLFCWHVYRLRKLAERQVNE